MKRPDVEKYDRQARRYVGKHWDHTRGNTKHKWNVRIELTEYIAYLESIIKEEQS